MKWHLLAPEFPPACGGVGDYTANLARALAQRGDIVNVWRPAEQPAYGDSPNVTVRSLPDTFGSGSRAALSEAWRNDPGVVLLQYVPHALGGHRANLRFCDWLVRECRARATGLYVMFHEPYFYLTLRRPWTIPVALVQRRMASCLVRGSTQIFYSTETWSRYLDKYGPASRPIPLPIPSTVPADAPSKDVQGFRERFRRVPGPVVGHFGTFGEHVTGELLPAVRAMLSQRRDVNIALVGRGSDAWRTRLVAHSPQAADRSSATGALRGAEIAAALRACDVLIEPYPDGVTTRRTTVMAGLCNAVCTVTVDGALTENVWRERRPAALVPAGDAAALASCAMDLASDEHRRREQGERGRAVYEQCFAIDCSVARLRDSVASAERGAA